MTVLPEMAAALERFVARDSAARRDERSLVVDPAAAFRGAVAGNDGAFVDRQRSRTADGAPAVRGGVPGDHGTCVEGHRSPHV